MELNIVQGYFLNFEFNFTQNERSQVIHSGGYGVYAGPFPKPGKNHTSFPYFPAGPREGEMLLTSLAPWGWFLWEKKKKILAFLFLFLFCCIPNPWPAFRLANSWCSPFPFHCCLSAPIHLFLELGLCLDLTTTGLYLGCTTTPIPPCTFT